MKVLIENYRGFDIEFDTYYAKFQCIITDGVEKESTSFKSVRKFIDAFKKENQQFKPFWILTAPTSWRPAGEKTLKVIGIRKDGRFVALKGEEKVQISEYNEKDYMLKHPDNEPILKALEELAKERSESVAEFSRRQTNLESKLNITTLRQFKEKLLK